MNPLLSTPSSAVHSSKAGTGWVLARSCPKTWERRHLAGENVQNREQKHPGPIPALLEFRIWGQALATLLLSALLTPLTAAEGIAVLGITEPFHDVTVSASVPGIVTARKFNEGDAVQEGQVLLVLDRKIEELEVRRREIVRDQKRTDFEGTKKLFSTTRGISKEDLDKKEVEYRVAAVETDMAAEQLSRRQLLSPLTGTISEVQIEVGESCSAYQPLIRIVDTRRCYFIANVEARHADRLKKDQTCKLEIESGDSVVTVQGRINYLAPTVDPASGLRRVKLLFENVEGRVVPGVAGRLMLE